MFNFDERVRSSDADDCTLASTSSHEKAGRVLIVLSVFILHQLEKNVLKVIPTLVSVPLLLWTANLLHLRRFLKQSIIIDVNWP